MRNTNAEKLSSDVPEIDLLAGTLDAPNMSSLLKYSGGVGAYGSTILDTYGIGFNYMTAISAIAMVCDIV